MNPDGLEGVEFVLDGRPVSTRVAADERLADVLRDRFSRMEVKLGCGEGECGACLVLLDGVPAASCLLFAWQVAGRQVTTLSGVSSDLRGRVEDALLAHGAVQCGFCTPGFVLSICWLLGEDPNPTRPKILEAISGNLCRCTGYESIVRAVENLAARGGES